LCCLFFFDIWILIAPLVSFGHCVVCSSYIKEEQTTQWPKDTKGVIRIYISKKNRQHNGQKMPKV
jgi:predicted nucleic acid-binding Zn ribbon protein